MSVATIVSIYPKKIVEKKSSHLQPSEIVIPGCMSESGVGYPEFGPVTIPIIDAKTLFYKMLNEWIESPVIAYDYAKSIVEDFFRSNVDIVLDPDNPVGPGIFAIDDAYTKENTIRAEGYDSEKAAIWVRQNYAREILRAQRAQDEWFRVLVAKADAEFNRTRNIRAISDIHRFAAIRLGVEKDWGKNITIQNTKCPACRLMIDPLALICPNCKTVVKPAELAKLQAGEPQKPLAI